jgi:hypothetical protein
MQQHKIEFKGKISLRGYTTTEDGGQSYDMLFTVHINRKWKSDATWFGQYAGLMYNLRWED